MVEDVLVRRYLLVVLTRLLGLNPCCGGRCSSTTTSLMNASIPTVLILVVVEDVLVPIGVTIERFEDGVLILVVVEDVLVPFYRSFSKTLIEVLILVVVEDVLVRLHHSCIH